MKINIINKVYILIAVTLIIGSVFKVLKHKPWDTYYYFSSVSVPETFPVAIREAYFLLPNDDYATISKEDAENFTSSWGDEYYSARVNDPQRIPEHLVLQYVSYRDQKFFSDTINVPVEKVRQLFKTAMRQNKMEEISTSKAEQKGLRFVVGIANEGNIIIWLRGKRFEKVIVKTKIKSHIPRGDDTFYNKRLPVAEYLEHAFERLPDSTKKLLKNGFDSHANYIDTPSRYVEKQSNTN
jgi:hypothetical protein